MRYKTLWGADIRLHNYRRGAEGRGPSTQALTRGVDDVVPARMRSRNDALDKLVTDKDDEKD